ncbi:hypothetical protein PIROE2DRAFT_5443 [Piromyces sp. E2]|nr:hypothetical protein PIROE2DRAFT_5443 [Piromyces sp. E2]|eukprot:OUM67175.1 hypothetical protein PIROE2DRAFT_5443 [Piromyces sp. E2]
MLATDVGETHEISALTYVLKQHQKKCEKNPDGNNGTIGTIVNISRNYNYKNRTKVKNMIEKLTEAGVIVFVSAGDSRKDRCNKFRYVDLNEVITIGGLSNNYSNINIKLSYEYDNGNNSNDKVSTYGSCVNIYAPFTIKFVNYDKKDIQVVSSTSLSSSLVAGVAATLMSENPMVHFNSTTMLVKLQNLALKDKIVGLPDNTPNYYINNGKHRIFESPRCDNDSKQYVCKSDNCCTQNGYCIETAGNYNGLCNKYKGCNDKYSGTCIKPFTSKNKIKLNYYDKNEILKSTQWSAVTVQENEPDIDLKFGHLSILSQGVYKSGNSYDNNYYYPSSAGKGVDLYIIDSGLDIYKSEEDFDTYKGTPDERVIQCDGRFYVSDENDLEEYGKVHPVENEKYCMSRNGYNDHGTKVAIAAVGKLNGAAKKANLHMLATDLGEIHEISALTYVLKQHQKKCEKNPDGNNGTIVNISRNCFGKDCPSTNIKKIIEKLTEAGVIVFVSAGNSKTNKCTDDRYCIYDEVITVGSVYNDFSNVNIGNIYSYDTNNKNHKSNYGPCVDIFAPNTIKFTDSTHQIFDISHGTSLASPLVAGVAATIISENPNIHFNSTTMLKKLQSLALKNVIKGLPSDTPNYFVNNGKKIIYQSPKCYSASKQYLCDVNSCCTRYGYCMRTADNYQGLCNAYNGCDDRFSGKCIH